MDGKYIQQFKKGALEMILLSLIARGETYGYELIKNVSPVVEISESTLYPILRRLEAGGLVSVRSAEHNGRLRKYYSITPLGENRITEFLSDWNEILKICKFIEGKHGHD